MTVYFAEGSADTVLADEQIQSALTGVYQQLGNRTDVIAVPPDYTRAHSGAGKLTCMTEAYYGDALSSVMPALGTHTPMSAAEIDAMYPGVPRDKFIEHNWREDVVTIGEVPAGYVREVTEGIWSRPWPAQMNKKLWAGGHDLIISIGQVVPHEVIGMANHNKNIFIGTGGASGINESHFIGAAYGMERMMGVAETPLRKILNYAEANFCEHLPLLYVLTVMGTDEAGELRMRGLFIGDDAECFYLAAALSREVNFTQLPQRLDKVVVNLREDEYHSTWLGNKAIYRTRMAIADEGELIILAPGVSRFGEDDTIDQLIRQYGYRTTPEIMQFLETGLDLQQNLSAAAHLIHGSSEGRFNVTYCPGHLTADDIESVGYNFASLSQMTERYLGENTTAGWNTTADGERFYYIDNPALGLWAAE